MKNISEKYRFNIQTGHYEYVQNNDFLNEDNNAVDQNNMQQTDNEQSNASTQLLPNIDTPEISQLGSSRDQKIKNLDIEIQKLQEQINLTHQKLNDAKMAFQKTVEAGGNANITSVTTLMKQMLLMQIKLENKIFDKAKVIKDDNIKIYNTQAKLLESLPGLTVPEKYKCLNESNIHMAKIYINTLVGDENWHLLHGMVDVKKAFGNSYLLYGKDKKGYFAVCIDQEDFDRMYNALQDVGYTRDVIIDAIMPQIFDRGEFIKNN